MQFIFIANALSKIKAMQMSIKNHLNSYPACTLINTYTYIVDIGVEGHFNGCTKKKNKIK